MRAVIQRVSKAAVSVDGATVASIAQGVLVLLGVETEDTREDIDWLCGKICRLRIFNDRQGLMNLSLEQVKGEALVVSQFTLHASTRKGNRPSFVRAARAEQAEPLYRAFAQKLSEMLGRPVKCGVFGAHMQVELINDGPVTLLIDSKARE